ncbi:hypothetical protein HpBGD84_17260 [Helicobacter pylori]
MGVNAMILSLLYKNPPDQLKLVMIDPKMVEFSIYTDIPHLLTPIITDPKKAIGALQSVAKEMERRYSLMSEYKVKTIDSYNEQAENNGVEAFPYLIVVICRFPRITNRTARRTHSPQNKKETKTISNRASDK